MRVWKKIPNCWRCDFFNSAQTAAVTRQNGCVYDEGVSGSIIYAYVGGNPLTRIDPDGQFFFVAAFGWGWAAAAADAAVAAATGWWVSHQNKTPNEGEPGSCHVNPGSGQERKYGSDGKPEYDIDWDHDHGQGSPHGHNWDGDNRDGGWPISPWPRGRTSGQNP